MTAFCLNAENQRQEGTAIEFTSDDAVNLLVGYFRDDQKSMLKHRNWKRMHLPMIMDKPSPN